MSCGCCCEYVDIFRCEQLPTGGASGANLFSDGGPLPDVICDCGLRATEIIAGREWSKYAGQAGDGSMSLAATAGAVRVAVSPVFFRPEEDAVFTVSMLGGAVEASRSLPFRSTPSYFLYPDEFALNGTARLCVTQPSAVLAEIGVRVDTAEIVSDYGVATWTATAWTPVYVVGRSAILWGPSVSGGAVSGSTNEYRTLGGLSQITAAGASANNAFYHLTSPVGFAGNAANAFEVHRDGALVGTLTKAWNSHYLPSTAQAWTWEYVWQEIDEKDGTLIPVGFTQLGGGIWGGWVAVQTLGTIAVSGNGSPASPFSFTVILDTPDVRDPNAVGLGASIRDEIYPRRAQVAFYVPRPCTVKVDGTSLSSENFLPEIALLSAAGGPTRVLNNSYSKSGTEESTRKTLYRVGSGTFYVEFQAIDTGGSGAYKWNGSGNITITVDVPPSEWYSPEDVSPLFENDGSYLVVGKITSPSPLAWDDDPSPVVSFSSAVVDREKLASVIDRDPGTYDDYYANVPAVQTETFTAYTTAFSAYMQPEGFGGYGDGVAPFSAPSITRSAHPINGREPSELQAVAKFSIDEGLYVGGPPKSIDQTLGYGSRFLSRPLDRVDVRFDRPVSGVTSGSFSITGNVPPDGDTATLPFAFVVDDADPKHFTILLSTAAQPWNSQWMLRFTPDEEMLTINEDGSEVEQDEVESRFMWGIVKDPAVGRRLTDTTPSGFGTPNINSTPLLSRDVMRMGHAASITESDISPVSPEDSSPENRMISFDSAQMYVPDALGKWSEGLAPEQETYVAGAPSDAFEETETPCSYFGWPYTIWPSPPRPFSKCSALRSQQKHASAFFGQREIQAIEVKRVDGDSVFWQPGGDAGIDVWFDSKVLTARFESTLNGLPLAQNHWAFADDYVELFIVATRTAMQYAAMETCVLGQVELVIGGNRVSGSVFPLPYFLPRGVVTPAMELAFIEGEEIEVGDLLFKAVEFGD